MSRTRSQAREWILTGLMMVLAVGSVAGLWLYTRNADRRQQLQSDRATELATRNMAGRPGGPSRVVWRGDTVQFPPRGGQRALLYVRRGECDPCERVDKALAAALRQHGEPLQVWVVHEGPSTFDGAAFRALPNLELMTSLGVGDFSTHFGIAAVPYLALLSPGGTVESVRVGYAEVSDIHAFVADAGAD